MKPTPMANTNDVIEVFRILRPFIGRDQPSIIGDLCRGEEGAFFKQKMVDLAGVISRMPHTYQTDGQGKDAVLAKINEVIDGISADERQSMWDDCMDRQPA